MSIPCPVIAPDGTEHPSLTRAQAATGINRKRIVEMIEDCDHGWRWRDGDQPALPKRMIDKRQKRVVSPRGRVYANAAEAANYHHVAMTTVREWCRDPDKAWHYEGQIKIRCTPPPAVSRTLYADNVTWRHPREAEVWFVGGGG